MYETVEISICITEGLVSVNIGHKFLFFTKRLISKKDKRQNFLSLTKSLCWEVWMINTL